MPTLTTEPIRRHWTDVIPGATATQRTATVAEAVERLGHVAVHDIDGELAALLAAAGAELAPRIGIKWDDGGADPPVAMLRLLARVAGRNPTAGGPHTMRLVDRLR